jgi:hypothetical protein
VNGSNLRPDQLRALRRQLAPRLRYLDKLLERLQVVGMSDTELYRAARRSLLCWEELDRAAINALARHGVVKEADDYPPDLVRRA